ncbi:MAG: DUF2541 family protein [Saprospiraceae bacterium]|nr:DUF2541 family protein [Saprospiraceae bacterium]
MKIQQAFQLLCFFALALAATAFTPTPQPAQGPRWELLGSRKVNYGLDRDAIEVTRQEGVFSAIKIQVKRSAINLHKIAVHYGNGEVQEIEARHNLPAGGETRVIDLPGNKRVIRKVVFWYDTKNVAARKGVIELWGRH